MDSVMIHAIWKHNCVFLAWDEFVVIRIYEMYEKYNGDFCISNIRPFLTQPPLTDLSLLTLLVVGDLDHHLVKIMVCHLFGAKPPPEPTMTIYQLDPNV